MAHFTRPIEQSGPLLNALLTVSAPGAQAMQREGRPVPKGFVAKGLVDTGASCTSIDPSVVEALGLRPVSRVPMITPSTGPDPILVDQYDIGVTIYSAKESVPLRIDALPVCGTPLINQGFHALIGRDILGQCLLFYNGATRQYSLSF